MKLVIDISEQDYDRCKNIFNTYQLNHNLYTALIKSVANGTSLEEELEKIKARIDKDVAYVSKWQVKNDSIEIINERISELKGEKK